MLIMWTHLLLLQLFLKINLVIDLLGAKSIIKIQKPRPKPIVEGMTWNNHKKRQGYIVRKCTVCHKLRWSRKDQGVVKFCRQCSAENARNEYSNQAWLRKSKSVLPLTLDMVRKAKLQMEANKVPPIIIDGKEYYYLRQ